MLSIYTKSCEIINVQSRATNFRVFALNLMEKVFWFTVDDKYHVRRTVQCREFCAKKFFEYCWAAHLMIRVDSICTTCVYDDTPNIETEGRRKRGHSYTWCGESLGLRRGRAWTSDDARRRRAVRPQKGPTARQGAASAHVVSAAGRRVLGRLQSEKSALSEGKIWVTRRGFPKRIRGYISCRSDSQ